MGVSGLWQVLNHAGESRSLVNLAVVDGFEKNEYGTRSFRLGIDASIWLNHAQFSGGRKDEDRGANPEIRTLFFRLCKWSKMPFTLVFVFDGRQRPGVKRGSRMGKSGTHNLANDFKKLLDIFRIDWREALGEAEAELGAMNDSGLIDAIVSDDVDTFLFGARMVLKNLSIALSGNKNNPALNLAGKKSEWHAHVYTVEAIKSDPRIKLTRYGMILIALLSGGDYDSGMFGIGIDTAHGLARLGFGDRLIKNYQELSPHEFQVWLPTWRAEMTHELHTNASGLLLKRWPSKSIPHTFPPLDVLKKYVHPHVHANNTSEVRDQRAIDLPALAAFCEQHFTEWGYRSKILERFRKLVYEGVVLNVFRASAREADECHKKRLLEAGVHPLQVSLSKHAWQPEPEEAVGTPAELVRQCAAPHPLRHEGKKDKNREMASIASAFPDDAEAGGRLELPVGRGRDERDPLVVKITRANPRLSSDNLLEYRVEICPKLLVQLVDRGIRGEHPEPGTSSASGSKGKGKGPGGRRSRRYEDTDTEAEEQMAEALQPASSQATVDEQSDEGDDEDGNEGAGKGKGKKKAKPKPEDTFLMWVPAPIMRHVHPDLILEFEDGKKGGKKAPTTRKKTARAETEVGEVPNADRVASALSQAGPSRVSSAGNAAETGSGLQTNVNGREGSIHLSASSARRAPAKPKGKGKSRARSAVDELREYALSANPYASFDAPREDIDVMADSSQPMRRCRFKFTWPETDDPDQLIVDTTWRDDLPTAVDYLEVENSGELVYREYAGHAANATPASSLSVGATRAAPPSAKFGGAKTSLKADGASATASARSKGKACALPEPPVENAQAQASGSRRSDHDEDAMAVEQEEDPGWRLYREYQENRGKKNKGKGGALPEPLPEQDAHAQTKKRKTRASEAEPTRAMALHEEHDADGWGASASSEPSRQAKRPKTTHDVAESVLDRMRRELDDEPVLPWQRGALRTVDEFPPLWRISPSRSPSPVYLPPSSSVQAPPPSSSRAPTPSSSRAPTPSSSRSTPATGIRRKGVPDADAISISSDSEDEDRTGMAGRKQTEEQLERWMQLPPFNNQPSLYSQRKAASSRGSVASTTWDDERDEQDERDDWDIDDDPWADIDAQFSQPRVQTSSSSRRARVSQKAGTGKRSYRETSIPSSSQESVL
ncbi:hypothetical protein GY45DRAFT_1439491 [Cubamyces sp. BRFM 1775]|nr:hypothetical protein GY45DRAFT_1439491 [Cubamyces sp. BRFM 1775]